MLFEGLVSRQRHGERRVGLGIRAEVVVARPTVADGEIGVVGGMHVVDAKCFHRRLGAAKGGERAVPAPSLPCADWRGLGGCGEEGRRGEGSA
jgi:hypothetical protein